jgi:ribosomal protein S6--L-glutamate ligase
MNNGRFTNRLTVGVLVERRYLSQRQPAALCAELRGRGHQFLLVEPDSVSEVGSTTWLEGVDIVVPRGRSLVLLSLVACAERYGRPVVNGRGAIEAVRNKLDMAVALVAAGMPTPRTYAGPLARLAKTLPESAYPVVLKPVFGDNGRGLRLVADPEQLRDIDWPEPVAIAQELVAGDGMDLKLYGIEGNVWAVRKPSPLTPPGSGARAPGLARLTPERAALATRCGELFGLDLYGVDCIETAGGPVVIEVNEYPNYSWVPDADRHLAELVESRAR